MHLLYAAVDLMCWVVMTRFAAEEAQLPTDDITWEWNTDRTFHVPTIEFIEEF